MKLKLKFQMEIIEASTCWSLVSMSMSTFIKCMLHASTIIISGFPPSLLTTHAFIHRLHSYLTTHINLFLIQLISKNKNIFLSYLFIEKVRWPDDSNFRQTFHGLLKLVKHWQRTLDSSSSFHITRKPNIKLGLIKSFTFFANIYFGNKKISPWLKHNYS